MSLQLPNGHVVHMPDEVGWTIFARIVRKPGIGWVFTGYSKPKWGRLFDAAQQLPSMHSLSEQNRLFFAEPGGQWEHV